MESEMKKHRYVDGKRRCVISLAVILTGCLIWGGCSVEEGRNADTGEESAAEKETVGVVFPVRGDPFAGEAAPKEENTGNGEAASKEENARDGEAATKERDTDIDGDIPLLEQLFSYEINKNYGNPYLTITGIAEEYRDGFWENMSDVTRIRYKYMLIPDDINGVPVRVVSEGAFAGMDIQDLHLPANLEQIGAEAFAGCSLERLMLPDRPLVIGERAFADNEELWTVLIPDTQAVLEEGVFENCRDGFLLCYGSNSKERENPVAEYAREQGFDCMEIILSQEPIVNYPDQPLVLTPEIRNFFYGDYENYEDYEEELWCSWEEDENAPNFGYIDWQAPGCSSWCGAYDFELEVKASSELASAEDRYSASNVRIQDRRGTWAEGTEGPGIGESLTYRQSCTYGIDNKWEALTYDNRDPELDGFMRYSEICIVNGYAKTQKTWEENGRVKKLLMYVEDRPYAYLELEDTIQPQYFELPEDDIKVINGGMLEARFEIVEVYPGSLYENTCLTGLVMEFTGRYAH